MQLAEEVHHLATVLRVEVARRLVGKDKLGTRDDGAGDGDALLLTAAELPREVLGAVADVHASHGFLHTFASLSLRHPHVEQRQFDVLLYAEVVDEVEALEDEADESLAQSVALGFAEWCHILSAEQILSACRGIKQSEDVEQCGLSAAAGAHDGDELAFVNLKVHAGKGDSAHLFCSKCALEVDGLNKRPSPYPLPSWMLLHQGALLMRGSRAGSRMHLAV